MQIGSQEWLELIVNGAERLGVRVSVDQAMRFAEHAELLLAWNRKINLTAITDPLEMAEKHFLDSVAPLPHIPLDAGVLDLGSGGGFPGLPLKVMRPAQSMTLIDASRKKVNFLKQVIRQLRLAASEALHIRAEELAARSEMQHRFGVVICRALSDLPTIVRLASPLLAPEGRIIAMKGPRNEISGVRGGGADQADPSASPERGFVVRTMEYRLPTLGEHRRLLILKVGDR